MVGEAKVSPLNGMRKDRLMVVNNNNKEVYCLCYNVKYSLK